MTFQQTWHHLPPSRPDGRPTRSDPAVWWVGFVLLATLAVAVLLSV